MPSKSKTLAMEGLNSIFNKDIYAENKKKNTRVITKSIKKTAKSVEISIK